MARTVNEIKQAICADFVANATIQSMYGLNPSLTFDEQFSKVSFEGTLFYIIAVCINTIEQLVDWHKEWTNEAIVENRGGILPWYAELVKKFQYGHTLDFIDNRYQYATDDPAARIVTLSAATEISNGTQILIKVAQVDAGGNTIPLTQPQLDALNVFVQKKKYAGVKVVAVSRDADLMRVNYRVYLDALVFNADGSLITDPTKFPVEDAINNHIVNLPFNGEFSITSLTDDIQAVDGVLNPVHQSSEVQSGTNPFISVTDYYTPNAGYMQIDPAQPLNTTLTYILK